MSTKKLRTIENLIMLTFPLVLFAGCAGNDVKPEQQLSTPFTISEQQNTETAMPAQEIDEPVVSLIQADTRSTDFQKDTTFDDSETQPKETDNQPASIAMPENKIFFFDTNNHVLNEQQRLDLRQHADYLAANPEAVLIINGHADVRGTEDYNQSLSEKRATETYQLLISLGVPESQLMTKGFGELAPMNNESNWEENRRVELQYTDPVMLSSM